MTSFVADRNVIPRPCHLGLFSAYALSNKPAVFPCFVRVGTSMANKVVRSEVSHKVEVKLVHPMQRT
jgi:hypothetical protein